MFNNIHNTMSDVLDNSYQYTLAKDIQIQTIHIKRGPKVLIIEIVTEDGGSTPCLIENNGFTRAEMERIMDRLTAAL